MTIYNRNSMVKKEHVKVIANELITLGSKVANNIDLDSEHCLANILHLAVGKGTFGLSYEQINNIKSNEFSISWK